MGQTDLAVHDAITGQLTRTLTETRGYHVRASHDGGWVVLGTSSNQSVLRRTSDWSSGPVLPEFFQGAGKNAAFSRDGAWMAIARGAIVGLVRTSDGELVAQLETTRSGTYVPELAFSPDGSQLALCWENGLFTLWDLQALRQNLTARGLNW
jgi:WD40 repeat protein